MIAQNDRLSTKERLREHNRHRAPYRRAWKVQRANQSEGLVEAAKIETGCIQCGECRLSALDMHHRDAAAKEFELNGQWLAQGRSLESVKREIAKCDVLCANCHRCLHADERRHLQ